MPIQKIVSGGGTDVDRGELDAAIAAGLPHGGWCPLGRRAEDGPIPARYQLVETSTDRYRQRTRQNVLDSDGTRILVRGPALSWSRSGQLNYYPLPLQPGT